jgi:hypothetical protein
LRDEDDVNAPWPVPIGELIADRFRIERLAGAGGMGQVFRAHDLATDRPVAVKLLRAESDGFLPRFVRESMLLREIDHPRVVRHVMDGELPSGERYLVMEWLDGEDLEQRLRRGRLMLHEAVQIASATGEGLGALHERGVVHRDVKPSNVFLVNRRIEGLKLLDLGIAQIDKATRMTRTGAVIGTLAYMAPEQARGDAVLDARTDVFALGCVLFECLTGERAFTGGSLQALLAKLLFVNVPRLREIVPHAPPALEELVAAMLSKRREERPADGNAVALALRGIATTVDLSPPPATQPLPEMALLPRHAPPGLTTPMGTAAAGRRPPPRSIRIAAPMITELLPGLTMSVGPSGLSDAERALLGLILLEPGEGNAALEQAAEAEGGQLVRLLDGSAAVLVTGSRVATDLAARAARRALELRKHAPDRGIAVATGFSDVPARAPSAELIELAAGMFDGGAAGRIVLDGTTAALLDARFDVARDHGQWTLRGRREPGEGRAILGEPPPPCVGRDRELRALEGLVEDCIQERSAQVAVVKGPPGVGKSRLARELARRLQARGDVVSIWSGRGDEARSTTSLRLLAEILQSAGDRTLGDASETGTAFIERVRAECAVRPLVIIADDLQWSDTVTTQVLDRALGVLAEQPLFLLALARPEIDDLFPKLWARRRVQEIRLLELPRKAAERMVRGALGEALEQGAVEQILELGRGNAFALEELIRAVAEGHVDALPGALVAMEQSRLGALDAVTRRLLRAASVYDSPFSAGAVAALLGGAPPPDEVAERLAALARQELLREATGEAQAAGEIRYAFWNVLQHEAARAMLTEDDLALGHRLAAERLASAGTMLAG